MHEELLELSRKADEIIYFNLDNNMDFLKAIKEKTLSIVACKSLKDLEKHFMSEKTKSNLKTHRTLWEDSRVHLHSNRNSKENSSEFTDECTPQVIPTSVKTRISDRSQNSGSTSVNNEKDNLYQDDVNSLTEENFNNDGNHVNQPYVKGTSSFIPVKDPKIGFGTIISDTETIKTVVDVSDSTGSKKIMQVKNFESKKRLLQEPACLKRESEKIKTAEICSNAEISNIHESEGENFNGSSEGRPVYLSWKLN
ncbi:hypothetical protein TNCT_672711 [Trichonephila clavata]|uniref:Uncharacterized protein n=1 Tax=Trichonephila clavata TaxID=2740835 RepID=A0A8X6LPJ2_TRICU|nr:hypothetical protein TNCT_672711 [Trichonephila clavata]